MPHLLTADDVTSAGPGRHHAGLKGLYLYVTPDGSVRRWIFRYTSPETGRVTETGLGLFPAVSPAQAQAKALEYQDQVKQGLDPVQVKRQNKVAQKAARITFAQAADSWLEMQRP